MAEFFDDDVIDVRLDDNRVEQYYWGEPCTRVPAADVPGKWRVEVVARGGGVVQGFVKAGIRLRSSALLRLSMVDVQQGDGLILETPSGKVVFIDGGDNKLFARRVAKVFPGTSDADPLIVDAMVITHGDADHFDGLNQVRVSETKAPTAAKKIFVAPKRVYHNGIVKRPLNDPATNRRRKDVAMFGPTTDHDGHTYITELADDVRDVASTERNEPFTDWAETLDAWDARTLRVTGAPIEVRRIDHLSGADTFAFLNDDQPAGLPAIAVELLGPITEDVNGEPALRFLGEPPEGVDLMDGLTEPATGGAPSASHTINGHSINFRLRYGNVRFLFTGDMNHESMRRLRDAVPDAALRAEILKTPHHGSADFDMGFLQEVGPVVSMISSGDESSATEHIHPRASLMAALGKASRQTPAVIFCTELAAFFAYRGLSRTLDDGAEFEGFERLNFGIIYVITDGHRVLTFTHSGKKGLNEAYRFTVSASGAVQFERQVVKRSAPPKN